jgi:hypothetical protein
MSQQKIKELLDEHDQEEIKREQEILEWSLKYLEKRKEREPPYKKMRFDEQEILAWSLNFLKERKERK